MTDLDAIYARIPAVSGCKSSCNACCGQVPFADAEQRNIGASAMLLAPSPLGALSPLKLDCLTCAFSTADGCGIYDRRPIICRLFGAVDHPHMTCPHGARAAKLLTNAQARELIDAAGQAT